MGEYKFTQRAQRQFRRVVTDKLEYAVDQGVNPYFTNNVRVDTGRMQKSIRRDPPVYDVAGDSVDILTLIGGINVPGVYKEVGRGRDVDYVEELYTTFPASGELQSVATSLPNNLGSYIPI